MGDESKDSSEMGERGEAEAEEASSETEALGWRALDPWDTVPDGCIPEYEIRIVSYIDQNGEEMYGYAVSDGVRTSSGVGLMMMAAAEMMARIREEDGD